MDADMLHRDLETLRADTMEIHRETMRLHRQPWWKPMALGAGLFLVAFLFSIAISRLPIW
jgi:hypothetical protein